MKWTWGPFNSSGRSTNERVGAALAGVAIGIKGEALKRSERVIDRRSASLDFEPRALLNISKLYLLPITALNGLLEGLFLNFYADMTVS